MGKAHLDLFALVARLDERLGPHQPARQIAGIFMNSRGTLRDGLLGQHCILSGQSFAVELGGAIAQSVVGLVHAAGGRAAPCRSGRCKCLARRPSESRPRENVPSSRSLASQTGMCGTILGFDQPAQERPVP